jgi:hypothetical protein
MGTRQPYHRTAQAQAERADAARSPEDAVRRLGLRCGLVLAGQRTSVRRCADGLWLLTCGGVSWRIDMASQDFVLV